MRLTSVPTKRGWLWYNTAQLFRKNLSEIFCIAYFLSKKINETIKNVRSVKVKNSQIKKSKFFEN